MTAERIGVVIPAYNAASTIDRTLWSVRGQTHAALDILVIDDGSTDETRDRIARHVREDSRVRMIAQANQGVAAARNRGWQAAQSDLISFIDADDLWTPAKLERQLAALGNAGPDTGLVYSRYAIIDSHDRIVDDSHVAAFEGDVLTALFRENFVGNGSAALVRRLALEAANGFDSRLRAAGAQGCEDILFYCRVAERSRFAVVPRQDVGYRTLAGAMSANLTRMLRSWMMVRDEMMTRHPHAHAALEEGLTRYAYYLVRQAISSRDVKQFIALLEILTRRRPALAMSIAASEAPRIVAKIGRRATATTGKSYTAFETAAEEKSATELSPLLR